MSFLSTRRLGWWLFASAFLVALATESGELNSIDTANRLQVTRWIWTDAPQVANPETSWFGVYGRGGEKFFWSGLGQSIWMLPSQIIASQVAPLVSGNPKFSGKFEEMAVTYLTFPLTTALVVVVLYALLVALGFPAGVSGLSALAALWCSSLLPYTNINQENTLILLCTLTAMWAVTRGVATQRYSWWLLAGTAAGYNMLIRLTSGLDAVAIAVFTLFLLASDQRGSLWKSLRKFGPHIAVAVLAGLSFVFFERAYNFYRFESWTNTYYDLQKIAVPDYLYEGDFRVGFPGLMWAIKSNIWQFDPLAALGLASVLLLWKRLDSGAKALSAAVLVLFAGYILFYSTRPYFDGDHGWGSRYTTTPMILLSALAVALILRFCRRSSAKWSVGLLTAITAIALVVQISSTLFWYNLEETQQKERIGASESMLVLRGQNAAACFTGQWEAWGLVPEFPSERLRTPNYLPFLAAKYFSPSANVFLYGLWGACVAAALVVNALTFLRLLGMERSRRGVLSPASTVS
jgi:hypothetical protein